jgi:hypothetical protein
MQEHDDNLQGEPHADLDCVDLGETLFSNLVDRVYDCDDAPCMSEVLAVMFAWMGRHKATDASAEDCWGMLGMLLPKDNMLPAFSYAKNILEKYLAATIQIIDVCPCDEFAYMDLQSTPLKYYQNAHRTRCPRRGCGLSRHVRVKTRHGARLLPRKAMYYLPLKNFLCDVFRDTTLPGNLHHDAGEQPPGDVLLYHCLMVDEHWLLLTCCSPCVVRVYQWLTIRVEVNQ